MARGRGSGLTEGYKYLPELNDHTVSQLETDGRAQAGHLAKLTPSDNLHKHKPPSRPPFLVLSLMMIMAGLLCNTESQLS